MRARFGDFDVDLEAGQLRKRGIRLKLQDQPFQVLSALLEKPGEVVTRDELYRRIWHDDTYVDFDQSLNKAVNKLRDALTDSADRPRYIETLPRRGYRFIGVVESADKKFGADADRSSVETSQLQISNHLEPDTGSRMDADLSDQHASDTRADLERLKRDASSDRSEIAKVSPRGYKKLALGTVAAISVLVGLAWFLHRPPARPAELTQKRLTFNPSENLVGSDAISPDGKYIAYSDSAGIHVKLLSTGEERLILKPVGVSASADWQVDFWFPDGTQLLANAPEKRTLEHLDNLDAAPISTRTPGRRIWARDFARWNAHSFQARCSRGRFQRNLDSGRAGTEPEKGSLHWQKTSSSQI
jgi:DNA-binding winged helix-turn-helix (wHTH) protein